MRPADDLDSITPYLSLAITAVSLIDGQQQTSISPSRLLVASAALRAAPPQPSAIVYSIAQACLRPLLVVVPCCRMLRSDRAERQVRQSAWFDAQPHIQGQP